eukprot:767436-Hanusia_phi.AAC.5
MEQVSVANPQKAQRPSRFLCSTCRVLQPRHSLSPTVKISSGLLESITAEGCNKVLPWADRADLMQCRRRNTSTERAPQRSSEGKASSQSSSSLSSSYFCYLPLRCLPLPPSPVLLLLSSSSPHPSPPLLMAY